MTAIWIWIFFANISSQPHPVAFYASKDECLKAGAEFKPTPKEAGFRCIPAPKELNMR